MFVDYVALMLINMAAGLCILALYLWGGLDRPDRAKWATAFAMPGVVAVACGLHMIWHWPLPGSHNSAFGEMSVFFGLLFVGAAVSLAKGWDLLPVAIYAPFAGLASILLGARLIDLQMTKEPLLSGVGFVLTGIAGVFAAPALYFKSCRTLQILGVLVLLAAAAIWTLTGYAAYWDHMKSFSDWMPAR